MGPSAIVLENPGEGTDEVRLEISTSYLLPANIERLTLRATDWGGAVVTLTGNALDNLITGVATANTIDGGPGADTLVGAGGADIYIVDDPGDSVVEVFDYYAIDTVQSSVSYTLDQFVENLTLTGGATVDGTGNEIDNLVSGNGAANRLGGGAGSDLMMGAGGNDTLDGGLGFDWLQGGIGDDTYFVGTALPASGLVMSGEPGEYVSDGRRYFYTEADGTFSTTDLLDRTGDGLVDLMTLRFLAPT